jgi:Polyketide cyclase / dehydrase and lipid transport
MGIHDYHLETRWLVPGTPREVSDVLGDPADLPRWWPSVYLEAEELSAGDAAGVGRRVRLRTRGWLPYTLDWTLAVTESRAPHGFAFRAAGDFDGRGEWSFESEGAWVGVAFDWSIEARKSLLRLLAPLFRPVLEANHRWAMRRGEESLRLELERRRAASEWERERFAAPPGPATRSGWVLLGAGAAAFALAAAAGESARRRRRRRGLRRFLARW